jgi:hypothetical protein
MICRRSDDRAAYEAAIDALGVVRRVVGRVGHDRFELAEHLAGHHHHIVCTDADYVADRYGSSSWGRLLDVADCGCDRDLRLAWATHRIERDFYAASIHVKDLAVTTGLWFGETVPSPGRALDGWEDHHLTVIAGHLTETGWEVLDQTRLAAPTSKLSERGLPTIPTCCGRPTT